VVKKAAYADRDQLPNYATDREHAQQVFREYSRIQHRYEPFVGWRALPFKGRTTTINEQGQRVHSVARNVVKAGPVVRFFGGSTMWGEGSDDNNTIPALFQKQVANAEVHNHGQLAYNTRQEVDALISLYSRNERSDVIIFYDGVNDAAFLCPAEIEELPAHRLVPMYREKLYAKKSAYLKETFNMLFTDNILKLITKKTTDRNTYAAYDCVEKPAKAEEVAEMLLKNWELANQIVTSRGGRFIAVLQPAAFIGKPRTDHIELDDALNKNFSLVYSLIRKKIAERNHPWIYDLSEIFNGSEYVFIDFCHVSPNGNAIMANRIAEIYRNN